MKANNLTGQRFGRLIVKGRVTAKQRSRWLCDCDCGNQVEVYGSSLTTGHTVSCGCYNKEHNQSGTSPYKELEWVAVSILMSRVKKRAAKKNHTFNLTREQFTYLVTQPCAYCGRAKQLTLKNPNGRPDYLYNGIDRLDSERGYEIDNVITACADCNRAKLALSVNEFLDLVALIYHHRIED